MGMLPVGVWNWIGSVLVCLWHVGRTSLLQSVVAVVVCFPAQCSRGHPVYAVVNRKCIP